MRYVLTALSWVAAALPLWPASGQDLSATLDDPVVFRQAVLDIAAANHPDLEVTAPADDLGIIVVDGAELALQNMQAKFGLSDLSHDALEQIVGDHVSIALNGKPEPMPDYDSAKARIRVQLMPREYEDLGPPAMPYPLSLHVYEVTAANEIVSTD
jgi:hypothetical protein